ncbi:zeta toxin family protein [Streptomyces sp. NPDC002463]|uniref:zeta toxin family protein n=1 Tax=Streptomyces sp. NPDC002463 TaxID=3364645 RepID=UPI00369209D6
MYSEYERLYLDLLDRAIRYERDWWHGNAGVLRMSTEKPGLANYLQMLAEDGGVTTADVYEDAGSWHRFRRPVHSAACPALKSPTRRRRTRQAYLFCGIPGSGKTTRLSPLVDSHRATYGNAKTPITVVNCDDIRERIPEYKSGLGSGVVQDESSYLTYRVHYPSACASATDVLIDSLGRPAHMSEYINKLSQAGCSVHVLLAQCPLMEAKERLQKRALKTGRLVPLEILEDAETDVKQTALKLRSHAWPAVTSWLILATGDSTTDQPLIDGTVPWVDLLAQRTNAPS